EDWGLGGQGECRACGHRDCFGRLPTSPERWVCFSANHETDSGGCGHWTGTVWIGDALDLEAHARKCLPVEVLRADGYLVDRGPATGIPPASPTWEGNGAGADRASPMEATQQRPRILVREELGPVTYEAEAALLADPDAGIYVRAGMLVRIVRETGERRGGLVRQPGSPVIQAL